MISITNTKDRRVMVSLDEGKHGRRVSIDEHYAYLPPGYQRRKWATDGVALSLAEFDKIAAEVTKLRGKA